MDELEIVQNADADYIERLYQQYRRDPDSVDEQWAAFFAGFDLGDGRSVFAFDDECIPPEDRTRYWPRQGVAALVNTYRAMGHLIAKLDPLGQNRTSHPMLELSDFGLSEADLDYNFGPSGFMGPTDGTLRDLLEKLRMTYCESIGVEYMDIADKEQRDWLRDVMESCLNQPSFPPPRCLRTLSLLLAAEEFEQFLHTKYVGKKRFSLEGSDVLIPLLETIIEDAAASGAEEIIMGMAHRGRLNVLAHILEKPYAVIFCEFEDEVRQGGPDTGDVKYHLGYSNTHTTPEGRNVHVSLSSNPSHLELINPVIEGIVRAKQEHRNDTERQSVIPILMHGEASFTGQGIVPETLGLSQLPGYHTGGTIHIIINNQVGFTATPGETRFTKYPTDVAKMTQAPIFHVNADDPDAVVHVARLAAAFRQKFRVDVFIDLWSYRRYGHNETDDPTFTQPQMYKVIQQHPRVLQLYSKHLIEKKMISSQDLEEMRKSVRQNLEDARAICHKFRPRQRMSSFRGVWKGMKPADGDWVASTAVSDEMIQRLEVACQPPSGFTLHPKLPRLLDSRLQMIRGDLPVDWGCAEMLAFGTLLLEGYSIRLAGEDSERGTFSHRHAVWYDFENGERYVPLENIFENQPSFTILNTMLSELAVLGFEYGMSFADPKRLVLWEAQFGDFVNGAQPIIDQMLASAESKWQRMSGISLLLPHGYEGQGPEHSSARLERFLQLCAENNMQVCYPTLPAQYFHVLRRQMHRHFRKPLILMTPKSLLRHKDSTSPITKFKEGSFQCVIDDPQVSDAASVRRLIFCSGKIYFDLKAGRESMGDLKSSSLIRFEQLYPFPEDEVQTVLKRYPHFREAVWAQEEPRNLGAWTYIAPRLRALLPSGIGLCYIGRKDSASPATGSYHVHQMEQKQIVERTFRQAIVTEETDGGGRMQRGSTTPARTEEPIAH